MAEKIYAKESDFYINPAELIIVHNIYTYGEQRKQIALKLKRSDQTMRNTLAKLYTRVENYENWGKNKANKTKVITFLLQVGIIPITEETYTQLLTEYNKNSPE